MTLNGKIILVTRPKDSSTEFCSLLESRGASTVCFPAIEIRDPDSWDACDKAIWKLSEYSCVCFTSKNAVTKLLERIRSIRPQAVDTLATRNIFAIGEKTKRTLETAGFTVLAAPKHSSAEELAAMVQKHQIKDARILFPKSNIALDKLPQSLRSMGAEVDEVITYNTAVPNPDNIEEVRRMLVEKKIDVVTFFSPSSTINFTEIFGTENLAYTVVAVIGPTTAETAEQVGLSVSILSPKATAEGLAETIEKFYTEK